MVEQAQRAASEGRATFERADEAAKAARAMAGEARIVAARAARPDLENGERLSYDGGASYVGQVANGRGDDVQGALRIMLRGGRIACGGQCCCERCAQ